MTYAALLLAFFAGTLSVDALLLSQLGFEWRFYATLAAAAAALALMMVAL